MKSKDMSAVITWLKNIEQGWKYDPTWSDGGFYGERYTKGVEFKVVIPMIKPPEYKDNTIVHEGKDGLRYNQHGHFIG